MKLSRENLQEWGIALAIFVTFSVGVWYLSAAPMFQGIDEGIYLEGGEKLLNGQMPYRDFFAFTGPLVYLVQAGLQKIFGPELGAMRWSVGIPFGILGVAAYAIARRFSGRESAIGAAYVQLLPHFLFYFRFHIGHRLLSMSFLSAAGACILAPGQPSQLRFAAAGAFAALAAWATPSFITPIALFSVWFVWRERQFVLSWLGGIAGCSAPFLIWLGSNGALFAMLENLRWTTSRYAQANVVSYGHFAVDEVLWSDIQFLAVPALIPITLAVAVYALIVRKQRDLIFLMIFGVGFFLTSLPRPDMLQLCYVVFPSVALAAVLCERLMGGQSKRILFAILLGFTTFRIARKFEQIHALEPFNSRVGIHTGMPEDLTSMATLEALVPAGSTLFTHPYYPVIGYVLRTKNPSSYSYLQPGMMSTQDEARVYKDLVAEKPQFMFRQYFPEELVLKYWPNSDRKTMKFPLIEEFIDKNYEYVDHVKGSQFELAVYRRRVQP